MHLRHPVHRKAHYDKLRQFAPKMLHPRNPPNLEAQISWYTFKIRQNSIWLCTARYRPHCIIALIARATQENTYTGKYIHRKAHTQESTDTRKYRHKKVHTRYIHSKVHTQIRTHTQESTYTGTRIHGNAHTKERTFYFIFNLKVFIKE